jgi:hypothetical protein
MAVKKTRDIDCFFNPCPPGYYCGPDNKCKPQAKKPGILGNTSAKIGAGLIGAGVAALGTKVAKDIKENRAAKKEAKKAAELPKQKKGGWIQGAIKRPGAFTAKAKAAGMSTSAYAKSVLKEGSKASTRTKRQANLAQTLGKMRKKK